MDYAKEFADMVGKGLAQVDANKKEIADIFRRLESLELQDKIFNDALNRHERKFNALEAVKHDHPCPAPQPTPEFKVGYPVQVLETANVCAGQFGIIRQIDRNDPSALITFSNQAQIWFPFIDLRPIDPDAGREA
jgi:hypothetical protein